MTNKYIKIFFNDEQKTITGKGGPREKHDDWVRSVEKRAQRRGYLTNISVSRNNQTPHPFQTTFHHQLHLSGKGTPRLLLHLQVKNILFILVF